MTTEEIIHGYFWGEDSECFVYGKILEILDFNNPEVFLYKVQVKDIFFHFEYFSRTPPSHLIKNTQ